MLSEGGQSLNSIFATALVIGLVIGSSVSLLWEMTLWLSVSVSCISYSTSGSAMAEGPRDALVTRNSATHKTSHLKTRVSGLSCGLFADGRTDVIHMLYTVSQKTTMM